VIHNPLSRVWVFVVRSLWQMQILSIHLSFKYPLGTIMLHLQAQSKGTVAKRKESGILGV
jgi:hypothetical protein